MQVLKHSEYLAYIYYITIILILKHKFYLYNNNIYNEKKHKY